MGIRKLKTGLIQIDYRDSNNRRIRESHQMNMTEAKALLHRRKHEAMMGECFPEQVKNQLTFKDLADKYWEIHGSKTRSSYTWRKMLDKIVKRFGHYKMRHLSTEEIQVFYNEIWQSRTSSTANRYLTLIKAVINTGIRLKKFRDINPCNAVVRQKENNSRWRYLSIPEIKRLLECCPKEEVRNTIICALNTGMRKGEILNLQWENVDLVGDTIYILESKSGNHREIPILPSLKRLFISIGERRSGPVFNLTAEQCDYSFEKALKQAKIENFRYHDLRHTFASHFVMNGGRLPELQKILGHSDFKLTLRYAHLSKNHLQQAIKVVENIIPEIAEREILHIENMAEVKENTKLDGHFLDTLG